MIRRAVVVAVLACLLYGGFQIYGSLNLNLRNRKHLPGKCRPVPGFGRGSEDFYVTSDGVTFVTSGMLPEGQPPEADEYIKKHNMEEGKIFQFSFSSGKAKELKIKHGAGFDRKKFHPMGVSVVEDNTKGEHLLYVVNFKLPGQECVEKFRFAPGAQSLTHVTTFEHEAFANMNNIAVVGEDKFYYSITKSSVNPLLSALELLLFQSASGHIGYYNGERPRVAAGGLASPNGVTVSKDGRFVYVSLVVPEKLVVFQRQDDGSLSLAQEVPLFTHPDNNHLSEKGDELYVGSVPSLGKLFMHLANPETPCPSAVLRLPLKDGLVVSEEITEVLFDHGDLISSSTSALIRGNKLLVGSGIHNLILCDL